MNPTRRQTTERVLSFLITPAGIAWITVLGCFLGWTILRQPELRAWLCGLVPHRYYITFALQRQVLAPRAVACAGVALALLTAGFYVPPRTRQFLTQRLTWQQCLLLMYCFAQTAVAIAVVINLLWFFIRTFGAPPCRISEEKILTYWVPQAYPHAQLLRAQLVPDEKVAFATSHGTFNAYLFSALSYPIHCYETTVTLETLEATGANHRAALKKLGIGHYLYYEPYSTTQPLHLRKVQ